MGPPRKRRKITATTRDIEGSNDSEQLSELNPVTVPDSVSPNTNQIRANQTVLSNNTNNDNQSSTLLNIDYARLAREIVRLQAGLTSTNVTTPVHSVPSTTIGNSIDHRDINLLPPLLTVPYVNENSQPSATSEASRTIPMQSTSVLPGNNCCTDSNVNFHNLIDSILSNEPSANVHNNYNAGQRQVKELTSEGTQSSTLAIANPCRYSSSPVESLDVQALQLLRAGLSESTRKSYRRSWELFYSFKGTKIITLPLSNIVICNFISYLFEKSFSPGTITSHVSAISYIHKILNIADASNSFIVRKMLKGCSVNRQSCDSRLPITKDMLCRMIHNLDKCIQDMAISSLLKAIFLLAFNALLRLGEILIRSSKDIHRVIQFQDTYFSDYDSCGFPKNLTITLRHFKNIKNNQPVTITLITNAQEPNLCPVQAMYTYVQMFKLRSGPLFQFQGGSPIPYAFVTNKMTDLLKFIGINPSFYKGHSFRIGGATHLANKGFSEQYIRKIGRWNSDAVQKYIRIPTFHI